MTVTAQVNTAPVLQLLAPAADSEHSTQAPALLEAAVMDQEDGDLSAAIHWQSSLQGDLGVGSALSVVLQAGQHTLSATVTDSRGLSAQQSVTVTVAAPPPGPVAHAGAGGAIMAGQSVLLDGSASVAAADSQWLWQQLAGDRVVINGADAMQASFNAPYRTTTQTLVFSLRITDAQGQISEAQVTYSLAAAKTLDQLDWLTRPLVAYWEAQLTNSELPDWLRSIYEGLLAWVLG